jgi:haloacetate dehalogenase
MQNPRHTSDAQVQSAVPFFEGFRAERIKTSGATIYGVYGGNRNGPPLLLLNAIPETHVLCRKIAPALTRDYTDLRGYGASSKPQDGGDHCAYSKRAMAQDQVDVTRHLGVAKFALVGHDRGGRAAHRLALDHPRRAHQAGHP